MILIALVERLKRRSKDDFKGRHYEATLILQAVSWYLRYPLSYRAIEELFLERGLKVDHSTLNRWVLAYAPLIEHRLRTFRKPHCGSIRIDETYIKIRGQWRYLYRAIDKHGTPVDFLLTATRDRKAAKHFFPEILKDQPLLAPELEKRAAWYRSQISFSWRVDETYVWVKGRWKYLYWAIDKDGATLGFYLARPAQREGGQALSRGGAKALTRLAPAGHNTDKNPAHGEAIAELKNAGAILEELEHRQAKYLNN